MLLFHSDNHLIFDARLLVDRKIVGTEFAFQGVQDLRVLAQAILTGDDPVISEAIELVPAPFDEQRWGKLANQLITQNLPPEVAMRLCGCSSIEEQVTPSCIMPPQLVNVTFTRIKVNWKDCQCSNCPLCHGGRSTAGTCEG